MAARGERKADTNPGKKVTGLGAPNTETQNMIRPSPSIMPSAKTRYKKKRVEGGILENANIMGKSLQSRVAG